MTDSRAIIREISQGKPMMNMSLEASPGARK